MALPGHNWLKGSILAEVSYGSYQPADWSIGIAGVIVQLTMGAISLIGVDPTSWYRQTSWLSVTILPAYNFCFKANEVVMVMNLSPLAALEDGLTTFCAAIDEIVIRLDFIWF